VDSTYPPATATFSFLMSLDVDDARKHLGPDVCHITIRSTLRLYKERKRRGRMIDERRESAVRTFIRVPLPHHDDL
jgi:hypothetical protein